MRNGGPRRAKGADGEREAARTIMANCPSLRADRNARNGKACSDVIVWVDGDEKHPTIFEVKRVESLDIGTKAMDKIRAQCEYDGALGILWRRNNRPWALDAKWYGVWVTFSGDDVWRQIERMVGE